MELRRQELERLLVSRFLLERIRVHPDAEPHRATLALQVLAAHDAAELALAAISDARGILPAKRMPALTDYFEPLASLDSTGPGRREVAGRGYFDRLNHVRNGIKHKGTFPDAREWWDLGERVYGYVSEWCAAYLGTRLDDLDDSSLLNDPEVKGRYDAAREAASQENYRGALEELAIGLFVLFNRSAALRGLVVGKPSAEDAIKLLGFGVHARDFLRLQEFLPEVSGGGIVRWKQSEFGHPANWREDSASFCLRSFLDVALKLQDAEWIPGAMPFGLIYEHRITAVKDGVEIWTEVPVSEPGRPVLGRIGGPTQRKTVKILQAGESLRGRVRCRPGPYPYDEAMLSLSRLLSGGEVIEINRGLEGMFGMSPSFANASDVKVTCVPRDSVWVLEHFGNLPEIDWEPE
jgi:hypothetical protein